MAERLTRTDVEELVDYLEAHWPGQRTKWANIATVYPTLAAYDADLLMSAARQAVSDGAEYMPGPVDVVRRAKGIIRARAEARRAESGIGGDHPRGHVWQVLPDVLTGSSTMRELVCVIVGCGAVKKVPATSARTVAEARVGEAEPSTPFG